MAAWTLFLESHLALVGKRENCIQEMHAQTFNYLGNVMRYYKGSEIQRFRSASKKRKMPLKNFENRRLIST